MRKYLLLSLIIGILFVVAGCTTEVYETGDGEYSYLRADFSMINIDSECRMVSFLTDDNKEILLKEPKEMDGAKPDTVYRALVYHREKDNTTELLGLNRVLVTRPFLSDTVKVMIKDPVDFESAWFSANGTYLNLGLNLKLGVADGEEDVKSQKLGIALDNVDTSMPTKKHYYTLYHDQAGVPEYYTYKTYISIPSKGNFESGDSVIIKINTYDGILRKGFLVP